MAALGAAGLTGQEVPPGAWPEPELHVIAPVAGAVFVALAAMKALAHLRWRAREELQDASAAARVD
jgi:hypothetical protein